MANHSILTNLLIHDRPSSVRASLTADVSRLDVFVEYDTGTETLLALLFMGVGVSIGIYYKIVATSNEHVTSMDADDNDMLIIISLLISSTIAVFFIAVWKIANTWFFSLSYFRSRGTFKAFKAGLGVMAAADGSCTDSGASCAANSDETNVARYSDALAEASSLPSAVSPRDDAPALPPAGAATGGVFALRPRRSSLSRAPSSITFARAEMATDSESMDDTGARKHESHGYRCPVFQHRLICTLIDEPGGVRIATLPRQSCFSTCLSSYRASNFPILVCWMAPDQLVDLLVPDNL